MGWVAVGMVGAMAMEARTTRRHGKGRLIRIRSNNETAQFLHFWYDFLVGDDWMIAAGVVLALTLSAGLARRDLHAWWVLPVAVVVLLTASLWRATRRSDSRHSPTRGTSGTDAGSMLTTGMRMDQTGREREEPHTQRR